MVGSLETRACRLWRAAGAGTAASGMPGAGVSTNGPAGSAIQSAVMSGRPDITRRWGSRKQGQRRRGSARTRPYRHRLRASSTSNLPWLTRHDLTVEQRMRNLFAVAFAGPGWTWRYLVVPDDPA